MYQCMYTSIVSWYRNIDYIWVGRPRGQWEREDFKHFILSKKYLSLLLFLSPFYPLFSVIRTWISSSSWIFFSCDSRWFEWGFGVLWTLESILWLSIDWEHSFSLTKVSELRLPRNLWRKHVRRHCYRRWSIVWFSISGARKTNRWSERASSY